MSNILNKMAYRNASKFVNNISEGLSNLYVYIGRPIPWDEFDTPPEPIASYKTENDIWNDMTAMKRVETQDLILGFKNISWISGTIYEKYNDEIDLSNKNFYVITDDDNVYKCIDNNQGNPSTYKPIHVTSEIKTYGDDYRWKYLFSITPSFKRKFAVSDYLPLIFNQTVINEAVPGQISSFNILSGGSGYLSNSTNLPLYVYGDGDEIVLGSCSIATNGGSITNIENVIGNETNFIPGTGLPVLIRQIGSSGAVETSYGFATINEENKISNTNINIVLTGSNYINGPATIVTSSSTGIAATDSEGKIIKATVEFGKDGQNYNKAKVVVVANTSGDDAIITPVISPTFGHGGFPERELFANYVIINLSFAYDEGDGDFTIENDFRRIGLIENPLVYDGTTVATEKTLNAKITLHLSDISGTFNSNDYIYGLTSGARGYIVDLYDNNKLRYIDDDNNSIEFVEGETITSSSGGTAVISNLQFPEVKKYSGDILFINNRDAISRSSQQIETITLVLEY